MNIALRLVPVLLLAGVSQAQAPPCPAPVAHISIQTGSYSSQPGVTFELRHFVAALVPQSDKAPDCYGKITAVSHAEIFVSNASLTRVFAEKLGQTASKIKNFEVQNHVGQVTLKGKIVKLIPIDFSISGPLTTDGVALLLDAREIKADGIPVKMLMAMVGEHLGSILKLKGMNGITVEDNRMAFLPEKIAHLKGYISSVETTEEGLTLRYGRKPAATGAAHPEGLREMGPKR